MTIPAALQLALQHHQAGQLEDAEAICRQVLAVERDHLGALCLLGVIARDRGRGEEAVSLLGQVCARVPENAEIRSQLAETYRKLGRLDEAIAEYRRVIETRPELAAAHYNLGIAWKDQDHLPEAISAFRTAVFLQPDFAAAHTNLGNALRAEGHFAEAIAVFRRVLQIQPGDVNAFSNLGSALADAGRLEEAIAAYREGLRLRPEDADLWNSLGIVFSKQARIDESVAAYGTALRLRPDLPWIHSNVLFNHHYRTDLEPEALFREHCRWDEVHAGPLRENIAPHPNDPSPGRRLRIGYVSADFCDHSVARFLEHLLAGHDRGQVEVFCYADLRRPDAVTARLRLHAAHWREIAGITDAQAAELIRRDGIDLLVDLAGHSGGNRLLIFARKPAPVQVTWLGYCDTTGMRVMDYRFTDAQADPPGMTEHLHTEQLVRLPETFACFRPADAAPVVGPLPALAGGHVTFASLHNLAKLNDPLLESWVKILHATPGSRLLLAATGLDEGECRRRFCEFFAQRGIGSERLELKGRVPLAEYLALHGEVDVLLDSHPFSGHTVSCHALWMGVPVVTLAGKLHCSRMVASVLANVGLPELIAQTPEQYVEIAVALATDLPRLAALRAGLRARMAASPLTDGPRFARHVEAAYRQMWRTWCAKQPALPPAPTNLGNALSDRGRFDEALASFRRVIELRPDFAEGHNSLGAALAQESRFGAASTSFRRAIELQPTFAAAHNNLGGMLSQQGRFAEAISCFRRVLQLEPRQAVAHSNLLNCLRYPEEVDAEAVFREHCRWDEVHARPLAEGRERFANDPTPDRRVRVGYVSPDFRAHSVTLFLENLLASHDRGQVEVVCYADLRQVDAVTDRFRRHAASWRDITGMTDAQAAELIREDQIDVLVDLAGHTAGNRLLVFARRPAPVQVTWLGYSDTTGMRAMDYRFTDAHADPPGKSEHLHVEKLVRLPETFACFRPLDAAPPVSPLPALVRGWVTFASFHALPKVNDGLLEWWVKILRRVPGSRLLLAATGLDEDECRRRFREFFAARGIDPARLELKGWVPMAEYLALHGEVDVLLDSHPFSGHTVSCHALWMGVPVVTLAGKLHCARMVASVLTNVGLPELIAQTPEQYVELAVALATDLPRLAALRAGLRARMAASPLTDGPRFARHVEAAYRQMWRTWCAAQPALSPP